MGVPGHHSPPKYSGSKTTADCSLVGRSSFRGFGPGLGLPKGALNTNGGASGLLGFQRPANTF
jgi:hypothetical protein